MPRRTHSRLHHVRKSTKPIRRKIHRFPICPTTGKRRLGERKDVKLALRATKHARLAAQLANTEPSRREIRGYRCNACRGWHLTSHSVWGRTASHARYEHEPVGRVDTSLIKHHPVSRANGSSSPHSRSSASGGAGAAGRDDVSRLR